jgi:muramidase (phage lysozyme)
MLTVLLAGSGRVLAGNSALEDLPGSYSMNGAAPVPAASAPAAEGYAEAVQYLPPNNNEPGFNWPVPDKGEVSVFYIGIGTTSTFLKASDASADQLAEGSGKCRLAARTIYETRTAPVFEGDQVIADIKNPLPGCSLTHGYVYMPHVSSTSAGGLWQLPVNVRAFLDTLAFSEGTKDHYNYIFTFVTFKSYADHPRKVVCAGKLCSSAAGRYQFLSKTWDKLAADLGLSDFTPPNQEKATLEIIRRQGVYPAVVKSSNYKNFTKAVKALNPVWASLPGSPYGQPTHTMARLWEVYQAILAGYR